MTGTHPTRMHAVYLTGYGGLEKLEYSEDAPVPSLEPGEVLIRVTAAGMNNTDINTRTGWYSAGVSDGTTAVGGQQGFDVRTDGMGDWAGDIAFPRIQGRIASGALSPSAPA